MLKYTRVRGAERRDLYFADATLASAFVARWRAGSKVETAGGLFQVREDDPAPRIEGRVVSDTMTAS